MKSLFRPFPTPLTNRQWFYLLVLQGVGAGIIDGGANFAIAYAMYHKQKVIKMWVLSQNTIAGDLGVTPIIQCLASMLITSTLVHTDLHHDAVKPLPFVWPHVEFLPDPRGVLDKFGRSEFRKAKSSSESNEKSSPSPEYPQLEEDEETPKNFSHYVKMLIRFIFEGTENNSLLHIPESSQKSLPIRILLTAAQGAAIGIIFGLPIFLVFIIVLGPLYKHDNLVEVGWKWSPMVIKCIYGAIVGWMTNPIIACLALGSQAEHHLVVIEGDLEKNDVENSQRSTMGENMDNGGGVEIIHEKEDENEYLSPPPISDGNIGSLKIPSTSNHTPTKLGRTRALSSLSTTSSSRSFRSRPPLTANCSNLPITSSTTIRRGSLSSMHIPKAPKSAPLPNGEFSLPVQPGTPSYTSNERPPLGTGIRNQNRNRGATISTFISNSESIYSTYSYALGGTGGRAKRQRPRAISSLSGRTRIDQPTLGGNSPKIQISDMNNETKGDVDNGNKTASASAAGSGGKQVVNGSLAVWDVFGKVNSPSKLGKNDSKGEEGNENQNGI